MGMTIAEKIIAAAAGVDSVKPGDIHTIRCLSPSMRKSQRANR